MAELLRSGSDEAFRRLVESVRDYAIFLLDREGVIASWNVGAEHLKGYAANEAIGRHFSVFYTPDAVARGWPAEELRRAQALGRFEDEGWRVRKDGSRFWANVVISPVRGHDGALLGFSKITRDLTERKRHEEQLRVREENLRLLVEGVQDHAMFLLDPSGRIRTWNAGARRVLGFDAENVLEQDASVLYPPEEVAAGHGRTDLAAAEAAGHVRLEGWRRRADGERFWAETTTTVLREDDGTTRGFVQIVHDLSDRRRVEALEAEGRRISEFIAMLSHELRNPLAPMRNALAILRKATLQPDAAWCVELVGRQMTHLSRLVDDLLDASRITNGKIRLDPVPLELNTMVRMAVDAARPVVQRHGHTLGLQLSPRPVPLLGDTTRLTQVIVNLIHNAAKYTPRDGTIRVTLRADGRLATLQVSDNGIGMSEPLLGHAFDAFVQGQRTLDRSEGGLGVGLTLVKRIVELHGGTVAASSAGEGQGTTITVTLPLVDEAAPDPPAGEPASRTASPMRILVVDDNRDTAESLAMFLRIDGHDVHCAYDGPDALRQAEAMRPGVVLLDIGLPGLSGLEVARRLRALPGLEGVRLVAITGYGQAADKAATAQAGFDRHLTKPVDPEALALALVDAARVLPGGVEPVREARPFSARAPSAPR